MKSEESSKPEARGVRRQREKRKKKPQKNTVRSDRGWNDDSLTASADCGGRAPWVERVYLPWLLAWPAPVGAAREALPSRHPQSDCVRARRLPGSSRAVYVKLGVNVALDAIGNLERILLRA